MAKINKFANIYDKDGNLVRKVNEKTGMLDNYTLEEVEELVDELTKKVQENPENIEYKTQLNNTQAFLFNMYNHMSKEDLSKRLSVLQNAIDSAKDKANEADKVALDHANEQLETLKNAYKTPESDKQDEYVDFEEVVDETNDKA